MDGETDWQNWQKIICDSSWNKNNQNNDETEKNNYINEEYKYNKKNVNWTDITIKIPIFKNSETQETINNINKLLLSILQERKISWNLLIEFIDNYNKFLAVVKQIKNWNTNNELKQNWIKYINNMTIIFSKSR